ncbi:hypothetical protein, partial [Streptococcus pneumoniae]|uniref:hypothetical protein n=1 Tax=Streptococcus pneumoniae TaxID=1313 RepID=UPI001E4A0372
TAKGERQERKAKAEKLPKECANCGTLSGERICPCCGNERKPQAGVETVDGELIEVTGKGRKYTRAEKQEWWSAIQAIRRARSRSAG